MIHYTVVIPQRDRAEAVGTLLPRLEETLEPLICPYEIICVDDGSAPAARRALEELPGQHPHLRLLCFDSRRGTSAALTAGVAAARGDLVIAVAPNPDTCLQYLPHLIADLSRADLVIARHQPTLGAEIRQRLRRLPRLLSAATQLHETEELFWAARREAVSGLALGRGAFRMIGPVVARRGFRVRGLSISDGFPVRSTPLRSSLASRLAAAWLDRHFEPHRASELAADDCSRAPLRPALGMLARGRITPQPSLTPVDHEP